jgi:rare lipoprotein A (peptidoglycan hydrolase)
MNVEHMRVASLTPTALLVRTACLAAALLCAVCTGSVPQAPAATSDASGGVRASTPAPVSSTPAGKLRAAKARRHNVATWFGPGLYGHKTACGQRLTPIVRGVASRTLPCGTLVRISYQGNAITVPVLDRGPYAHGVEWDLTTGAAQALDIVETVRIKARVVGSTPNVPTLGLPPAALVEAATGGAQA